MATHFDNTLNFDLSTDAHYQAVWGLVDAQIQALGGWSYQAQTGDSDPAATATGSNGTYPSWRVYKTTVAGQDWYLRLDYGHDANGPALKSQISTTVDGSGGLGSQKSTQQSQLMSSNVTGASRKVWISSASGRLLISLGQDLGRGSSFQAVFHADVDGSGSMTNTGMQCFNTGQFAFNSQPVPASGFIPAAQNQIPCNYSNSSSVVLNSKVITGHPFLWTDNGGLNVTPACCVLGGADGFSAETTTTISLYSTTRTFLVTGHTAPNGVTSAQILGYLYE